MEDGRRIAERVAATGLVFCLTHNYRGYPMLRQMRAMVEAGRELRDVLHTLSVARAMRRDIRERPASAKWRPGRALPMTFGAVTPEPKERLV